MNLKGSTRTGRNVVRCAVAVLVLVAATAPAAGLDVHEVPGYVVHREVAGSLAAAVASDGFVLLAWNEVRPEEGWDGVRAQWLAPDGAPLGEPFDVTPGRSPAAVAARPGRNGLVLSRWAAYRESVLTVVDAQGVVRQRPAEDLGCDSGPVALTAPASGYFLACGGTGWWLGGRGRPLRQVDDLFDEWDAPDLAGGPRRSVFVVHRTGARLSGRWITPRQQGAPLVLDAEASWGEASVQHLGAGRFGVAWVRRQDAAAADGRRLTEVRLAIVQAPGVLLSSGRVSHRAASPETAKGEHLRPQVLSGGAPEEAVAWSRCAYTETGGEWLCIDRERLFLRDCTEGAPVGAVTTIDGFGSDSRAVLTGDRLLILTPLPGPQGQSDLAIRPFVLG